MTIILLLSLLALPVPGRAKAVQTETEWKRQADADWKRVQDAEAQSQRDAAAQHDKDMDRLREENRRKVDAALEVERERRLMPRSEERRPTAISPIPDEEGSDASRGPAPAHRRAAAVSPEPAFRSDVDEPHYSLRPDPKRLALVIGVEDYATLPKAEFAARDAFSVAEHLRRLGVADRNLAVIVGSQAARGSVAKYVEGWLKDRADADSRVFVYFSGHGAPDPRTGQTYLMPWDGDAKYLAATGYPLKSLYAQLDALPAKEVVVVLDACFSGAGGRSVLPAGARPLVTKVDLGASAVGKTVVFAASAGDEITGTVAGQGHGLFTYYFLKGLDGSARTGSSGVSVQDLYEYLRPQVEDAARRDGRDQRPQLLGATGARRALLIKDTR